MTAVERPLRVAVVGGASASGEELARARDLGRALAEAGAVVVCGGRGGVMAAVAEGAAGAGGVTVGILPGEAADGANPWISIPLATGLGDARNALVVGTSEAVVAVGGSWGTVSEIALARKKDRPVILLGPPAVEGLDLPRAEDPLEAAAWAVAAARRQRGEMPSPGSGT